ncbi:glycosyltransferase family 2 protein [Candidatus Roizmanbacteria bacterium]|nr:glycosyltransferase family 2 protein [Candidatus Roizmanbacteria bacterium]
MKKLISVCIPTYNRAKLLDNCLSTITSQFSNRNVYQAVEIVISNNNSVDNTEKVISNYMKKYSNIRCFKNKKTIQADKNIIATAAYAKGEYIWFFGDDDAHYSWSLKTMIKVIHKYYPDAVICNLDMCSKDGSKILDRNMINLRKDFFAKTKKELFTFLESKFFMHLDWYITCMSNTIVSRKLFDENIDQVMKFYDPKKANFLHSGLIFYNDSDYKVYLISKHLVIYRGYNILFGPDERTTKSQYLAYLYKMLKRHNDTIYTINKKNMSLNFAFLLYLKNLTRDLRSFLVKYIDFDFSDLLIKLFHKKET